MVEFWARSYWARFSRPGRSCATAIITPKIQETKASTARPKSTSRVRSFFSFGFGSRGTRSRLRSRRRRFFGGSPLVPSGTVARPPAPAVDGVSPLPEACEPGARAGVAADSTSAAPPFAGWVTLPSGGVSPSFFWARSAARSAGDGCPLRRLRSCLDREAMRLG